MQRLNKPSTLEARLASLLGLIALLGSGPAPGGTGPALVVNDAMGSVGQTVMVRVSYTAAPEVENLQADINYDRQVLTALSCSAGDIQPGGTQTSCNPQFDADTVRILTVNATGTDLQDGTAIEIAFFIEALPGGGSTLVGLSNVIFTGPGGPVSGTLQSGLVFVSANCTYDVVPDMFAFGENGGMDSFAVDTAPGCDWTAETGDAWIQISASGQSGSGPGEGTFSVAANPDPVSRSGTLTVAGTDLVVNQASGSAECTFGVTPGMFSFAASGGVDTFEVDTEQGCDWTVTANRPWIRVTTPGGAGPGVGMFSVEGNSGPARAGTLTVAGVALAVEQAGAQGSCTYVLSPDSLEVPAAGGPFTFSLETGEGCSWSAVSDQPWLMVADAGSSGNGPATIPVLVAPNPGDGPRTARLEVADSAVSVITQAGSSPATGLTAVDDTFSVKEDRAVDGDLVANDTLTDAFTRVELVGPPPPGELLLQPGGRFTYRPRPNFDGTARFMYRLLADTGSAASATAQVTIVVDPAPDPAPDLFSAVEGTVISGSVIRNDDLGDGLGEVFLGSPPPSGMLTLGADGTFEYHAAGPGSATFTYGVRDRNGDRSRPTQVSLTITPDPSRVLVVDIDPAGDVEAQVDAAIATANDVDQLVRVRFGPGTYAYGGGGKLDLPVAGTVRFEASGGSPVIRGDGASGPWLDIDGGRVEVVGLTVENFAAASGGAFRLGPGARLELRNATVRNNLASAAGGAIQVSSGAELLVQGSVLSGNEAADGGAIWTESGANVTLRRSTLLGNSAGSGGGLFVSGGNGTVRLNLTGVTVEANAAEVGGGLFVGLGSGDDDDSVAVNDAVFADNSATDVACDLFLQDLRSDPDGSNAVIRDASFFGPCGTSRIEVPAGGLTLADAIVVHDGVAIRGDGLVILEGTVLSDASLVDGKSALASKSACETTAGTFQSLGFNISSDASCGLDQGTDLSDTDPMLQRSGKDFSILAGSPMLDNGPSELVQLLSGEGLSLPCGYKDTNGLGRPQDGDDDGTYECDAGNVESKTAGAPDVSGASSSAYFDPSRPGEGVFVEVLEGGLVFAAMFTYAIDGSGPAWMVGVGQGNANTMVVDEMLVTTGGRFGEDFDADAVVKTAMGGLSLVFRDCEAGGKPGRMAFDALGGAPFTDLLVDASRLSTIVACGETTPPEKSGRSGSFYDPARDGEGIFVQWLSDGRVLVIWYTYDPEGNQFWTISDTGNTTVDGDTVTAGMLYPAQATAFGEDFDPSEVVLDDWGTVTLEYDGCNALKFSYESTVEGFGSGTLDYVRLTSIADTDCDL